MPKLPDYPSAGGLTVAESERVVTNATGPSWGSNESPYTAAALSKLPAANATRQRFTSAVAQRIDSAADAIPVLQAIVDGAALDDSGHEGPWTTSMAERQLVRVMHRSTMSQMSAMTYKALNTLPPGNSVRAQFVAIARARLADELYIRDNGPSILAGLPAAPA